MQSRRFSQGLTFALISAASFSLSGTFAKGLLESGWSAGTAVTVRIAVAGVFLALPGLVALRGRWELVRRGWPMMLLYGAIPVVMTQLCYFYAIGDLDVGVALLIEYTAPAAVVTWMWLRHGQRPSVVTCAGAVVSIVGLVFLLELVASSVDLNIGGVLWALGAMVGAATYFIVSADESIDLPPVTLAAGGLLTGAIGLGVAGAVGIVPVAWSTTDVVFVHAKVPWWAPLLGLGVITAAIAYSTGIIAARLLGSRIASFVALSEVIFAIVFAWWLLAEQPSALQGLGAALVLGGVVIVKLGERSVESIDPTEPVPPVQ